jgi:hypothetical protein
MFDGSNDDAVWRRFGVFVQGKISGWLSLKAGISSHHWKTQLKRKTE